MSEPISTDRRNFLKSSVAVSSSVAAISASSSLVAGSENSVSVNGSFSSQYSKQTLTQLFHHRKWNSTITLFLPGGFSHLDSWCHCPELARKAGQSIQIDGEERVLQGPVAAFKKSKGCEFSISSLFPHLSQQASKISVVHGVEASCSHHGIAADDWSPLTNLNSFGLVSVKKNIQEKVEAKDWFGLSQKKTNHVGNQLKTAAVNLLSGIRHQTVRVFGPGLDGWDAHRDLVKNCHDGFASIDKPMAGLLEFLASTGQLESTLILCISEFGRSPFCDHSSFDGRGHQNKGFSVWVSGGEAEGNRLGGKSFGEVSSIGLPIEGKTIPASEFAKLVAGNCR